MHRMRVDKERVVVTGLGAMTPIGHTVPAFWEALKEGKNGIRKISLFDPHDYCTDFAGEITITPECYDRFQSKKIAKRLDRYIVFGYLAGTEAIEDAGIAEAISAHPQRYSSFLSSGSGGTTTYNYSGHTSIAKGMDAVRPMTVLNVIPSTAAGYLAQVHNLQGPSFSATSACSSSNYAIALSTHLIRSGLLDGAIVGGSEAAICPVGIAAFGNILALSRRSSDHETASRPFDVGRDGFVMGEGGGALCLERLDIAKKRGARIYCEVSGFGWSCDAHDLVSPREDGQGGTQAVEMALKQAGIGGDDISLINAHATATPIGDIAEYHAMRQALGAHADLVATQSTKSFIGHLLGGSSGVAAVALIMAFEHGYAHHTINQFKQDPRIKFNVIKEEPLKIDAKHILSNGFGFGGQNASIIFSKFTG